MHCVKCLSSQSKPRITQDVFTQRSTPAVGLCLIKPTRNKPEITRGAARQTSNINKAAREYLPQQKGWYSVGLHLQIFVRVEDAVRKNGAFPFQGYWWGPSKDYERIEEPEPLLFFHQGCYKRGNRTVCKKGWRRNDLSTHSVSQKNRIKGAAGTEMQTELVRFPSTEYNFFSPFIISSIVKGKREKGRPLRCEELSHRCSAHGKTSTESTLCNLSTALLLHFCLSPELPSWPLATAHDQSCRIKNALTYFTV